MEDLAAANVDVLTLGQYLQPTQKHLPVHRFVHPDEFAALREIGYKLGFDYVESGPLVRSSYHSERHVFAGYGRKKWMEEKEQMIAGQFSVGSFQLGVHSLLTTHNSRFL